MAKRKNSELKRCKKCKKLIRSWNKSGLCEKCHREELSGKNKSKCNHRFELISKEIRKNIKTGKYRFIYARFKCKDCGKIKRIYFEGKKWN